MTKRRNIPERVLTSWKQDHAESYLLAQIGLPGEDHETWELARLEAREEREQGNQ